MQGILQNTEAVPENTFFTDDCIRMCTFQISLPRGKYKKQGISYHVSVRYISNPPFRQRVFCFQIQKQGNFFIIIHSVLFPDFPF